ncbi:MAG TPA: copper resistance protein CopC [Gaiella sp.]
MVAALAIVGAASAHATLVSSTPANDEVLRRAPAQVVLRFNEPVETAFGSVRVYDGAARRVDDGHTTRPQPQEVAVGLRQGLPKGTYTVAWRVISADSHPVSGAFVFHVGKPGAGAAGIASQVLGEQAGSATIDRTFDVVRFLNFAFILLCAGGAGALALVFVNEASAIRRPLWAALAITGVLLAVASVAAIGLEGAKASGLGLGSAFRASLFRDVLETQFGKVSLARAGLALAVTCLATFALWRPGRTERSLAFLAGAVGAAIAITPASSGHARVEGTFAVVVDWVHVLGASAWAGGLAFLLLALWRAQGDRWPLATRVVPRFSLLAVVSVTALLLAGVVSGYLEVRSWNGLWDTTYGRLLLVKVALLLPVLALGAFNNRVSVPRLRAGIASTLERRRFLRSTATELALVVAIVGVTAVLVAEPPAKAQVAAQAGPVSQDTTVGPFDLNLVVDPARTGRNQIHLYLLEQSTGQPANVDEIQLSASLPAAGVGPLRLEAVPAGPGHAIVTGATFPLVGDWRLRLDVRRGDFDQWTTTLTVPIRKDT